MEHTYTGPLDDELADSMLSCDPEVRHMFNVEYMNQQCNELPGKKYMYTVYLDSPFSI